MIALPEDITSDVDSHKKARDIVVRLANHFRPSNRTPHFGMEFTTFGSGQSFLTIRGAAIGLSGEDAKLWFEFGPWRHDFIGVSGYFSRLKKSNDPVVLISCLDDPHDPQEVGRRVREPAVQNAILHELIHYLDSLRNPTLLHAKSNTADANLSHYAQSEEAYFNSPAEFNAYSNNMADPLLRFLGLATRRQISPASVRDTAEHYGVQTTFNATLAALIQANGEPTRTFWTVLNRRNRKALLRRLYKLYAEARKIIDQAG